MQIFKKKKRKYKNERETLLLLPNKAFPSYRCLIAFFCSLFNLILKPFLSSMQSTFCKHSSNPSLLSAILNLYDENVTSL